MPPLQSETRTTHQYESKSRTIGVLGLRTGPGTLRNGGTPLRLSHRARMVPRAQVRMSLRTPPRMNHHVTVDSSDQSAPRVAKTVRGTKLLLNPPYLPQSCLYPEQKPYPPALTALTFRSTLNLPILFVPSLGRETCRQDKLGASLSWYWSDSWPSGLTCLNPACIPN